MRRFVGHADAVMRGLPTGHFDLVVTSPPAYPSMRQEAGALGTEGNLEAYLKALAHSVKLMRRVLTKNGFLVLVIEPVPGFNLMRPLVSILRRGWFRLLTTYHWSHSPSTGKQGGGSWVIFLGRGQARLNRDHPAWNNVEWFFPRPKADLGFGFYEWPQDLVDTILGLTIPAGGRVLDPFAGKAVALSRLGPRYDVVAVDVMDPENAVSSVGADEGRHSSVADEMVRFRGWPRKPEGVAGGGA